MTLEQWAAIGVVLVMGGFILLVPIADWLDRRRSI